MINYLFRLINQVLILYILKTVQKVMLKVSFELNLYLYTCEINVMFFIFL